jgi:formylglycine-generating enzyme required for sulfatase activity
VVSTDAPVPAVVSRLRIDVFADDRWIESRDAPLRSASEWPASFTVFTTDTAGSRRVLVRLRAYREGALRDYRGERYLAPPPAGTPDDADPPPVAGDGSPRLLRDGDDRTPRAEPIPESAIDRLVEVDLREGDERVVEIELTIACAGTMADLRGRRTCVDERNVLRAATDPAPRRPGPPAWRVRLDEDAARLPKPRQGGRAPDGSQLFDEEIVVLGGAFVLGSRAETAQYATTLDVTRAVPERVFVAPPFLVDRYEVTVARWRDAVRRGLVPASGPRENSQPVLDLADACTYSKTPLEGAASRESHPVTCVTHDDARRFCAFEGGDLPTELEWEWMAAAAGRARKSAYPWGDVAPECGEATFGRLPFEDGSLPCAGEVFGPGPVDLIRKDVTPSGIVGLAANVLEWVRDPYLPYSAACWAAAPLYGGCMATVGRRAHRGNGWGSDYPLPSSVRGTFTSRASDIGFRCVRRP